MHSSRVSDDDETLIEKIEFRATIARLHRVHLDGKSVRSCLLAVGAVGKASHRESLSVGGVGEKYHQIKARMPLLKPKLRLPYPELQALAVL